MHAVVIFVTIDCIPALKQPQSFLAVSHRHTYLYANVIYLDCQARRQPLLGVVCAHCKMPPPPYPAPRHVRGFTPRAPVGAPSGLPGPPEFAHGRWAVFVLISASVLSSPAATTAECFFNLCIRLNNFYLAWSGLASLFFSFSCLHAFSYAVTSHCVLLLFSAEIAQ
jgi:hypothetical protein